MDYRYVKDLIRQLLDGSLIMDEDPKRDLPTKGLEEFNSLMQYCNYWKCLYKYEFYCRLFPDTVLIPSTNQTDSVK